MTPTPEPPPRRSLWRLVFGGALIGAAVAGLIALRQPNHYAATAILARSLPASAVGKSMFDAPPPNWDPLRVLAQTDVVGFRVREKLQQTRDATNTLPTPKLEAFPSPGSLLTLRVTTTNFAYAKDFVTAWASELVDFAKSQRRGQVGTARALAEQQILSLERQHEQTLEALEKIRAQHGVAPGPAPWAAVETAVGRLQEDLLAVETRKGLPPEFPDTQAGRLLELQFEIRRLENRLGSLPAGTATDVKAGMEAELKVRHADLRSFEELLGEARKAEAAQLDGRKQALAARLGELRRQLAEAADLRRQLAAVEREEQLVAEQLDAERRELAALGRVAVEDEEMMVVQAGIGSEHPVGPNRPRTVLHGSLAGGLAGLAFCSLWRWLRRR